MGPVRVGFIGAGGFANAMHYPNLAELPDAALAAVCDLEPDRLQRTADRYQVAARYTDYHAMLDRELLDAVYVVMPPMTLTPIVLDCLRAGKPVFIEKPPGLTTDETRAMAQAARDHGVFGMVGFNRRYSDVFAGALRRVQKEGPLSSGMAEFHKNMLREGPYYGVSILRTDVIHVVDALRAALGDALSVHSLVTRGYADWRNGFNALIAFEGGASGLLSASRTCGARYERFELHGRGVSAYVRAPDSAEIWRDGQPSSETLLPGDPDPRRSYGYLAEDREFLRCVREKDVPPTSLDDAVKTMELVDAIEGGRELRLGLDR